MFGLPLPRTSATYACAEKALEMTGKGNPLDLLIQDLNIVKAIEAASTGTSHDANFASIDPALGKLMVAIEGHGANVSVKHGELFSRLMIKPGRELAKWRVNAVRDGVFYIYPSYSELNEDAWEVRWLDRGSMKEGSATLKLERFLDWGLKEYSHGVELCAALGHGKRLSPETLAEEDPITFWQSVFRFSKVGELFCKECVHVRFLQISLGS